MCEVAATWISVSIAPRIGSLPKGSAAGEFRTFFASAGRFPGGCAHAPQESSQHDNGPDYRR
jgi:hypothetical protein